LVQHHVDTIAVAAERLVDAVIDDFLRQVIGPRGVGVHARALAHRVQAGQYLDGFGGVIIRHAGSANLWRMNGIADSGEVCRSEADRSIPDTRQVHPCSSSATSLSPNIPDRAVCLAQSSSVPEKSECVGAHCKNLTISGK